VLPNEFVVVFFSRQRKEKDKEGIATVFIENSAVFSKIDKKRKVESEFFVDKSNDLL
jgi:hypothetical protein